MCRSAVVRACPALHRAGKNRNVTVAMRQAELEDEDLLRQLREAGIDPDAEADQDRRCVGRSCRAVVVQTNIDPDTGKPRRRKVKGKVKLPPHGRIYPVIACYDETGGDKFVHLRDSFGELLSIYGTMINDNPTYQRRPQVWTSAWVLPLGRCLWRTSPLCLTPSSSPDSPTH